MKADVLKLDASSAGSVELNDEIFGLEPRRDILHRAVVYQLAKRQQGTHKTKERNEISATGKKFGRQKGSGGARHGDRKAPIFVGGGVAHGPRVRSHAIGLPKKVRRLALKHALSAKQAEGSLIVIDEARAKDGKTKTLAAAFAKMNIAHALVVDREIDEGFDRAARNLPGVDLLPVVGANVYDILRAKTLVLTKAAVEGLNERLSDDQPTKAGGE